MLFTILHEWWFQYVIISGKNWKNWNIHRCCVCTSISVIKMCTSISAPNIYPGLTDLCDFIHTVISVSDISWRFKVYLNFIRILGLVWDLQVTTLSDSRRWPGSALDKPHTHQVLLQACCDIPCHWWSQHCGTLSVWCNVPTAVSFPCHISLDILQSQTLASWMVD